MAIEKFTIKMVKLIPLLTDPAAHGGMVEDAFDEIVPSMDSLIVLRSGG